jgi:hypothetical protein
MPLDRAIVAKAWYSSTTVRDRRNTPVLFWSMIVSANSRETRWSQLRLRTILNRLARITVRFLVIFFNSFFSDSIFFRRLKKLSRSGYGFWNLVLFCSLFVFCICMQCYSYFNFNELHYNLYRRKTVFGRMYSERI